MLRTILLGCFALFSIISLSACGGGGSSSAAPSETPVASSELTLPSQLEVVTAQESE